MAKAWLQQRIGEAARMALTPVWVGQFFEINALRRTGASERYGFCKIENNFRNREMCL
ncbi:hypothetical protein [Sagittula stellata]|uniref:Uncharacterized protein n=1 Tax=Sagittula stellata (strain ATCC 700073 / DSM 11524 / E-37) TaxID=388399 RepID=A3K061_SAGS3|nr:hypothetical protein [Sagittula stellata]EBA09176.1 hypothetical protein SSE37_23079 [Sagittula stellata E-37]